MAVIVVSHVSEPKSVGVWNGNWTKHRVYSDSEILDKGYKQTHITQLHM